jgi:hypothetical protein
MLMLLRPVSPVDGTEALYAGFVVGCTSIQFLVLSFIQYTNGCTPNVTHPSQPTQEGKGFTKKIRHPQDTHTVRSIQDTATKKSCPASKAEAATQLNALCTPILPYWWVPNVPVHTFTLVRKPALQCIGWVIAPRVQLVARGAVPGGNLCALPASSGACSAASTTSPHAALASPPSSSRPRGLYFRVLR